MSTLPATVSAMPLSLERVSAPVTRREAVIDSLRDARYTLFI